MAHLAIKLTGQILSSNFDEWKRELIMRIQGVNAELKTDNQFAMAAEDVKQFKAAELALKKAKESAINQAADIQRLFAAIDEVSEEVRQVRLSLERQIKRRKVEIKEEFIQSGLSRVRDFIKQQDDNFKAIDHRDYLDRHNFEEALKGRTSVQGLSVAIDEMSERIKQDIATRAADVRKNATKLDSLPAGHKALFQDRRTLLALAPDKLDSIIDERIAVFQQQVALANREAVVEMPEPEEREDTRESDEDHDDDDVAQAQPVKEAFLLTLELFATPDYAEALLHGIRSSFGDDHEVVRVRLERT